MTVVNHTVTDPESGPVVGAQVVVDLYPSGPGYVNSLDSTVIAPRKRKTDSAGLVSFDLVPNANIIPAGTVYRVRDYPAKGIIRTHYIEVPVGGGPYWLGDLLVDPPASLASPALTQHIVDPTDAHDASAVSLMDAFNRYDAVQVEAYADETAQLLVGTLTMHHSELNLSSFDLGDTFQITDGDVVSTVIIQTGDSDDIAAQIKAVLENEFPDWGFGTSLLVNPQQIDRYLITDFGDSQYAELDDWVLRDFFTVINGTGGVTGVFTDPLIGGTVRPSNLQHYIEGAGRTNGADFDFLSQAAYDGFTYTVRNTTDGKVYLTTRSSGTWYAVELT